MFTRKSAVSPKWNCWLSDPELTGANLTFFCGLWIIARSAFYVLCVSDRWDPCLCVCCCCLLTNLWQIYTEQQRGDHAVARWWFDWKSQKIRVYTVFGPVSNQVQEHQPGFRGLENGHFSLFLDQFQIKSRNTRPAFKDPKMITLLFTMSLCASRPCSAECCLN